MTAHGLAPGRAGVADPVQADDHSCGPSSARGLCERQCESIVDALQALLALTTALRDAYKRHYWHGLTLPLIGLRMMLGAHTREQTDLIGCIEAQLPASARAFGAEPRALGGERGSSLMLAVLDAIAPETESVEARLDYLVEAHQALLIRAHALANRLAELGDIEVQQMIAQRVVPTNERQAVSLTRHLLAERNGMRESTGA